MLRSRGLSGLGNIESRERIGDAGELKWVLGVPYTGNPHLHSTLVSPRLELLEEERREDVFSTMWITYRSGFPRMEPYGYTDDSGWGCMLRSAQMLMAQGLQRHLLGRSWRVPRPIQDRLRIPEYRRLVELFTDHPGEANIFSIHNMCQVGVKYDKLPGEWYGPTTAAHVLRDIAELFASWPPSPLPKDGEDELDGEEEEKAGKMARGVGNEISMGKASQRDKRGAVGKTETFKSNLSETAAARGEEGDSIFNNDTKTTDGKNENLTMEKVRGGGGGSKGRGRRRDIRKDWAGLPRPVRVFVSQGDVVYADEVEAAGCCGFGEDKHGRDSPSGSYMSKREGEGGLGGSLDGRSSLG
ncbi:unnamed protein product, partial [Choristocarpus tenellus]